MAHPFTEKVKKLIKRTPRGKVATYGQIAALAGSPAGARQVSRILHSCSRKDNLPWHRIVNRKGKISLEPGNGFEIQMQLLIEEGVVFDGNGIIDFDRFLWKPDNTRYTQ